MEARTAKNTKADRLIRLSIWISLFFLTGCVGIGHTSLSLTHDQLSTESRGGLGKIAVLKSAEDQRTRTDRIGHATWGAYAFESGTVTSRNPLTEDVALQVKRALESVGYEVIMIEPGSSAPPSMSTLKVTITEFYFKNYNWLWPVVPTWGQIELSLALHKPDGTIGLKKSLRGNGTSYCLTGDCAFGSATKEAMTEVLNRIVAVCLTDEFRQALTSQ